MSVGVSEAGGIHVFDGEGGMLLLQNAAEAAAKRGSL